MKYHVLELNHYGHNRLVKVCLNEFEAKRYASQLKNGVWFPVKEHKPKMRKAA